MNKNSNWAEISISEIAEVTDYVANGSFATLKQNVQYLDFPGYAILIRLTDYKNNWKSNFKYVTEDAYHFLRKSIVVPGDIIIANVGATLGTVFCVPDLGMPMTLAPNTILA